MRQSLQIALLQFRQVIKNRGSLIMMFIMPLLLTTIFGVLSNPGTNKGPETFPVALIDEDGSFASKTLVDAMKSEPTLKLRTVAQADLNQLFSDKAIAAAVVIPAGFQQGVLDGKQQEVHLVTAPSGNPQVAVRPVISRLTARVALDYRLAVVKSGAASDETAVGKAYAEVIKARQDTAISVASETVSQSADHAKKVGNVPNSAVGFTVLFVMMAVFMMGGIILQERQDGTWGRLLTTPTPKLFILTGYLLSFFITGMFQFGVLIGVTSLVFGMSWGPLLPLAAIAAAFVLCSGSLGVFLAGLVKTAEQQRVIGIMVVVASSMLGGVYWPLDFVGDTMKRIGYLMPQAWAMDGFRAVMLGGSSFDALKWPLTVLLGLSAIFLTAGLLRVRYE